MHDIVVGLGPVPFDDADRSLAQPFMATMSLAELAAIKHMTGITDTDSSPLHEGIIPFDTAASRQTVGALTDVGDVSWVVPTVQCTTAVSALGTPAHSWQLVAQGKLPAAHKGMIHAAKIMGSTAAGLLTDDGLRAKARDEFNARISGGPTTAPSLTAWSLHPCAGKDLSHEAQRRNL
jgi:aminobenzoyl-glutamate utilization protein B